MKKITIALLWMAVCSYLFVSCHKPDIPCKKYCQIKSIQDTYHPNPFSTTDRITRYAYNNYHLLDSLTVRPVTGSEAPVNIKITYNNQGKPVGLRDNQNRNYKFIYQSGRIVRIDLLGADNQYHLLYTFIYDAQGRIIERQAASSALRWEYEGTSVNPKRKLDMQFMRPGEPMEVYMAFEYEYDNKVNPMTTWPNMKLVPFYLDIVAQVGYQFEPIPQNNWTRQNVLLPLRGILLPFREYLYTYQYDDVYPVKYDLLLLTRNPFISNVDTTRGTTIFTYNCVDNNTNSKL